MVHGRKFVIAACLLLWANSQAGAPAQALTTGTVQLSYVDPADVTVSLSGPVGYAQELQVTGGQVFTDLQPGTYELRVTKEGYGNFSESLEVVAGKTADAAVTLEAEESAQTLDDPGTLQITWVDPGDVKVTVRGPDGYAQETTVTGGQVFTGLAAGSYEVTTSKVGFQSSTQTLEVPADGTTSLSVVLEKQEGDAQAAAAEPEAEVLKAAEDSDKVVELSLDDLLEQGSGRYVQAGCSGCHGGDGGGNQGPAFAANDDLADTEYVARIIVRGNGGMPSFGARLSDEEIASVATYIRNSWGNNFGAVNPTDVATQR